MNSNIELIRKLKWEEVFLFWYLNEGERENWKNLAKERGFASWADWRLTACAKKLKCQDVDWGLYEVIAPGKVISKFYGGQFRVWTENYYSGEETKSFKDLSSLEEIINNPTINAMMDNFPVDKTIICLELADGRIFTIEGMHRCCALALMERQGKPTPKSLRVIIGKTELKEFPAKL